MQRSCPVLPVRVTCCNKHQTAFLAARAAPEQPLDKAVGWLLVPDVGGVQLPLGRGPRPCPLPSLGRDGTACSWPGKGQLKRAGCCQTTPSTPVLPWCGFALVCHPPHLHISKCFIACVLPVCTRCSTGSPMGRAGPCCAVGHPSTGAMGSSVTCCVFLFSLLTRSSRRPGWTAERALWRCVGKLASTPTGRRMNNHAAAWRQRAGTPKPKREKGRIKKKKATPQKQQHFSPIFIKYTTNSKDAHRHRNDPALGNPKATGKPHLENTPFFFPPSPLWNNAMGTVQGVRALGGTRGQLSPQTGGPAGMWPGRRHGGASGQDSLTKSIDLPCPQRHRPPSSSCRTLLQFLRLPQPLNQDRQRIFGVLYPVTKHNNIALCCSFFKGTEEFGLGLGWFSKGGGFFSPF